MSTIKDFDIDTLTLLLHQELNFVATAVNNNQQESGLAIERIKLRMGQKHEDSGPFNSVLDSERYPDEEAWEIELAYNARDVKLSSMPSENERFQERQLIESFKNEPIHIIKGVSLSWNKKWNLFGVKTIEDLALKNIEEVQAFAEKHGSINPLSHYNLALTLNHTLQPFLLSQFSDVRLMELLTSDLASLKRVFQNNLSVPEILILQNQARILFLALDISFVKKLTLAAFK